MVGLTWHGADSIDAPVDETTWQSSVGLSSVIGLRELQPQDGGATGVTAPIGGLLAMRIACALAVAGMTSATRPTSAKAIDRHDGARWCRTLTRREPRSVWGGRLDPSPAGTQRPPMDGRDCATEGRNVTE